MAFARDGSLILGFRDRFMDVIGSGSIDPRPGHNDLEYGMSGGDITMACATADGGYTWEGTGSCPNHATPTNDGGQDAGVVEYFPGDYYGAPTQAVHIETAQGSVAYIPQQQWVVSTDLDPARHVGADGVSYYHIDTGLPQYQGRPPLDGYEFVTDSDSDSDFGKAGGLGDIAYAAANAPIQIGNIVWFDNDHNGVQDAYHTDEVPLPKATVNLLDANGKQVDTTTTDAAGEYYFGGVGAKYELTPGAKYTVQFDVCTADTATVPEQPPATDLRFTLHEAGKDRAHDSNVEPPTSGRLCNGFAPVTAPAAPGGVDHTIDAGVYIPKPTPPPTSTSPKPPTTAAPPAPAPPQANGGLAHTGVSATLPKLIGLGALLVVGGAVITVFARRRRARH